VSLSGQQISIRLLLITSSAVCEIFCFKRIKVTTCPFRVTWRHSIPRRLFVIGGASERSPYLQLFSRYWAPSVLGSRAWPSHKKGRIIAQCDRLSRQKWFQRLVNFCTAISEMSYSSKALYTLSALRCNRIGLQVRTEIHW